MPRPVFGHGQLYVALSRSGNPPAGRLGVRIVAVDTGDGVQGRHHTLAGGYTRNVAVPVPIFLLLELVQWRRI